MIDFAVGLLSGAATVLMWLLLDRRFRKHSIDRFKATLEAAPGKSELMLTDSSGVPHIRLILARVETSFSGGSRAEFEDYTRFMENRKFR